MMPTPRLAPEHTFEIGRTDRYTGSVSLARLLAAADDSVRVYEVRFAPGARTVWHTHAGGQWLIGLVGLWVVQVAGESARQLGAGEVAYVPAGVLHWHGAKGENGASHLVLNVVGATDWAEPLSAEEYAAVIATLG
ncbi:MAG TPA: cupin domain-containing protein [Gemmatimonadales bacterium]